MSNLVKDIKKQNDEMTYLKSFNDLPIYACDLNKETVVELISAIDKRVHEKIRNNELRSQSVEPLLVNINGCLNRIQEKIERLNSIKVKENQIETEAIKNAWIAVNASRNERYEDYFNTKFIDKKRELIAVKKELSELNDTIKVDKAANLNCSHGDTDKKLAA